MVSFCAAVVNAPFSARNGAVSSRVVPLSGTVDRGDCVGTVTDDVSECPDVVGAVSNGALSRLSRPPQPVPASTFAGADASAAAAADPSAAAAAAGAAAFVSSPDTSLSSLTAPKVGALLQMSLPPVLALGAACSAWPSLPGNSFAPGPSRNHSRDAADGMGTCTEGDVQTRVLLGTVQLAARGN